MGSQVTAAVEVHPKGLVMLRGTVNGVTSRILAEAQGAVSALTEVRFTLNGTPVVSRIASDFLDATEGDDLVVTGYWKGAEVWITSWWNNTKRRGHEPKAWLFWPSVGFTVGFSLLFAGLAFWSPQFLYSRESLEIAIATFVSLATAKSEYRKRLELRLMRQQQLSR